MYFTNWHGRVSEADVSLLYRVQYVIQELSRTITESRKLFPLCNVVLDCHSITRFLAKGIPELEVVTGSYLGISRTEGERKAAVSYCPHSWLVTPDGAILDPYPVGVFATESVVLVSTKPSYWDFGASFYLADGGDQADKEAGRKGAHSLLRYFRKYHKELAAV